MATYNGQMTYNMGASTPADIAASVVVALQTATPVIPVNMVKTVGTTLQGDGTVGNKFRSTLVP